MIFYVTIRTKQRKLKCTKIIVYGTSNVENTLEREEGGGTGHWYNCDELPSHRWTRSDERLARIPSWACPT